MWCVCVGGVKKNFERGKKIQGRKRKEKELGGSCHPHKFATLPASVQAWLILIPTDPLGAYVPII